MQIMNDQAKILVVDDHPTNLQILLSALGKDYQVSIVTSGKEALQLAEKLQPDLILLDIMMPVMDGLEVLERIRKSDWGREMAVILVTADDRHETHLKGLQLGADDFITKPFSLPLLQLRIRNLLARDQARKQLDQMAYYDALTGLPNRSLLYDRLHQAMAQADRRDQRLALVFLDLDGFKPVNDNFGHEVGDLFLKHLALKMKSILREGDTLARLGGDEFIALLVDLQQSQSNNELMQRLLSVVSEPYDYKGHVLRVTASIGVSYYPQSKPIEANQLIRQADQAMYRAKQSGKNQFCEYQED
ncbi:diguanylate cyclase [Thiomicrospira microaerophila]|uniref:diguanylate cyclase domain-containing protein n=1 Tax=Thiomicrospira microaerophila TaxID=406020 RepID=UPI00200BC422|nr:diguanylate cyclase [Thiomicrospira microaerophila]UQB42810.1 diguanylate cyclase [Thiomicrospira microaerophila]